MPNKYLTTGNVEVVWASLEKPDDKYGEATAHHQITVKLTPELEAQLNAIVKELGGKKINGVYENKDGVKCVKFKSRQYLETGVFPCVDSLGKPTTVSAFKSDVVRLKVAGALVTKGMVKGSVSFYLNAVQIVTKNAAANLKDFEPVAGGFVSTDAPAPVAAKSAAPQITDDEMPF
jgi:hypothetical protein